MIDALRAAVKLHVTDEQTGAGVDADLRVAYSDDPNASAGYPLSALWVLAGSTTPVGREIGPAGTLMVRNTIDVVGSFADHDVERATARRDAVALALTARHVRADWPNVPLGAGLDIVRTDWGISYADVDPSVLAAWFTLSLTFDVEWRV